MAGEKFTITLAAKIKKFLKSMAKATKSVKKMGMQNRGIIKDMQQMGKAARNSANKIAKSTKKSQKGFASLGNTIKKTIKGMGKLTKAGLTLAATLGALKISILLVGKAWRAAKSAAQMDVQAKAFANLAQSHASDSKKLLKGLKEASEETVTFMELMTTASRALLLGIEADKLVELMTIARAAAKAMGTTVASAFSDISLGIGRQSRLILDNLGIIVKVGPAYARYAAAIGTTADALTAFEKKQAFQSAVLEAGRENAKRSATGYIDFQDKILRANTFLADSWVKVEAIMGAFFFTISQWLTESKLMAKIQGGIDDLLVEKMGLAVEALGGILDWLNSKVKTTVELYGKLSGIYKKWKAALTDDGRPANRGDIGRRLPTADEILREAIRRNKKAGRKSATTEVFEDQIKDGEEGSKKLEEAQKTWTERTIDNYKAFLASATGQQTPTRSDLEVAITGVEALNEAFKDVNVAPQDLQRQFAQMLPVIEKGFKTATTNVAEYAAQLEDLKKKQIEVSDESFIASLGLQSDKQFSKGVDQALGKIERLLNAPSGLKISNPKRLLEVTNKLLADVRANFNALTKEQKQKLAALNKQLANIIPVDNIKMGLNQWVDQFNSATGRMAAIGVAAAEAMSTGFDNFLFDSVMGKITSLEDAFNNMFKSILRQVTKFVGDKATQEFMGLAFGAQGTQTHSRLGLPASSIGLGGIAGKIGGFFGKGGGGIPSTPGGGPPAPGGGGLFSGIFGGIKNILGFADGGIGNFSNATGSAMVTGNPTLAAIAEKPGKREAVMPLEKFTDLVQPVNINISTIDTKSFQQYMMDNKETVLGTIMGIKGSRTVDGLQKQQRGPF